MGEGKKIKLDVKKATAAMLRGADQVYVIWSQCTRMPYVVCDAKTYDDEVLLYFREEDAKEAVRKLTEEKQPVQAVKAEKQNLLAFYVSLMPMGVNCILVNRGTPMEMPIQLHEIIRRQAPEEGGKPLIENPQLHLTALYFMQEIRRAQKVEMTQELRELQEEMLVNYQRGKYIVPVRENAGTLVMKQKDGQVFQPIFTDMHELRKFLGANKEGAEWKTAVIAAENIPEILAPEASGVIVNPLGVNLQLQVKRKEQ